MLILNGRKFARNDAEFTGSLFDPSGTCVGFYKPHKRQITLHNMQGEKIGCITSRGVLAAATKQSDGHYWYSYATIQEVGEFPSYMAQREAIHAALDAHNIQHRP
jgi:hypothetical protein